jgi:hypothetical protein
MGHKGTVQRPTCIGTERARSHLLLFSILFNSTRVVLNTVAEHNLICLPLDSTVSKILLFFTRQCLLMPISVAAPSKAWVCGRSLAGIAVWIPPGSWTFLLNELCVLSGRGLCVGPITCTEESYRVLCLNVVSKEKSHFTLLPQGAVEPRKKKVLVKHATVHDNDNCDTGLLFSRVL